MGAGTILVFLLMLVATLAYVGAPLLRPAMAEEPDSVRERRRVSLQDEKERLLSAVGDLEHDHQTGKMDSADFRALSDRLRADAAKILRDIDLNEGRRLRRPGDSPSGEESSAVAPAGTVLAADSVARLCTRCGAAAKATDDRFCGKCGATLPTE